MDLRELSRLKCVCVFQNYLSTLIRVSLIVVPDSYICGFHNAREIREVLAIFSRDLMKNKLGAVGVSGRDPADDDNEYTLE